MQRFSLVVRPIELCISLLQSIVLKYVKINYIFGHFLTVNSRCNENNLYHCNSARSVQNHVFNNYSRVVKSCNFFYEHRHIFGCVPP